jgi:hypothetical protein
VGGSKNPNIALLHNYWSCGVSRTLKSSISCFFYFTLVCCFAGYCGVALVTWFQWWSAILVVQWILFMSNVNHISNGRFVPSLQRNERMWRGKSYMKLAEVKKGNFFASGEKLSSCLLLIRRCWVCLEFHRNQLGTKVPLDFFFSWT